MEIQGRRGVCLCLNSNLRKNLIPFRFSKLKKKKKKTTNKFLYLLETFCSDTDHIFHVYGSSP